MAVDRVDTSSPDIYNDINAQDSRYREAAGRGELVKPTDEGAHETTVTIETVNGEIHRERANIVDPSIDLGVQRERLERKAANLTAPLIGKEGFESLVAKVSRIENSKSIEDLVNIITF